MSKTKGVCMLYIHDYKSVLEPAKQFYDRASFGQSEEASSHLETFYKEASKDVIVKQGDKVKIIDLSGKVIEKGNSIVEKFNPSLARMAMQQAQCDINAGHIIAYMSDELTDEQYKQVRKNHVTATFALNRTNVISHIDQRIKETYPKTYQKRLSIIPFLQDGVQVMLKNKNDEKVSQTEKVFGEDLGLACVKEFKKSKKFNYILRKLFTK